MTAQAMQFIWWVLATFGVAGLVAFWFLAPTAARLALQAVVAFFSAVLSYRIGCALLAAIVVGVAVDQHRHSIDDARYAAQTAAFEQQQTERDAGIEQKTRAAVWTEIANATAENASIDQDVKDFSNALPPVPFAPSVNNHPVTARNPFVIDAAAAVRLCKLAGQAKCGPVGGHGMPKARRSSGSPADHGWKIGLPGLIRTGYGANKQSQ